MVLDKLEQDWRPEQIARLHGLEDLRAVEARLYHRPRKILGWRTPAEPRLVFLRDGTLLRMDRVGMTSGRPALLIG